MSKTDTMSLRHKPEASAIAVEAPRSADLDNFKSWFVVPVQQLIGNTAFWIFVSYFQCLRAKPLNGNDYGEAIGQNSANGRVWLKVFEPGHEACHPNEGPPLRQLPFSALIRRGLRLQPVKIVSICSTKGRGHPIFVVWWS